jgi:hypothetical protein
MSCALSYLTHELSVNIPFQFYSLCHRTSLSYQVQILCGFLKSQTELTSILLFAKYSGFSEYTFGAIKHT